MTLYKIPSGNLALVVASKINILRQDKLAEFIFVFFVCHGNELISRPIVNVIKHFLEYI